MVILREPARPAVIREHPLAPWFAVAAVCLGAFMGQLDASVVTVAFPALQRQFGAGLASVQWVSLAYLLVLAALLVPAGRWSDRAGRKLMYLYGFVVFAGSSAACGLAPSLGALIVLRVVQAAGAALLQANSVALVVTSVPARTRRAALGVQAAAQAIGLASGPVIGGLLVAAAGWRLVFFLNVPVGVLAVVAGVCLLPRTRGLAGQLQVGQSPAGLPPAAQTPVGRGQADKRGNNAEIMAAVPARDAAAAGGMVNMTRGIGTALGVAVVTLGLHAGALLRSSDAGLALSMAALGAVALLGTAAALRARPAADGPR